MRILFYIGQMNVGGAERQLNLLAEGLIARGADVRVITEEGKDAAASPSVRERLGFIPPRPRRNRLRALVAAVAGFSPDVFHALLTSANFWGAWAARKTRVRVFVPSFLSTDPWKKWHHLAADRWVASRAAGILANSRAVAARYAAVFPARADRIRVIYNGVDVDRFAPQRLAPLRPRTRRDLAVPGEAPLIINVANLHPVKNQGLLLAAVAACGPDVHLLLAGDGPRRAALERQARDLGIRARVRFLGQVEDIAPYLAAADVFALSSDAEGFSNALLEAMAAGLPCVATAVGGNAEALEGGGGVVVPPRDVGALTGALRAFINDPARRQLAGAQGQGAAAERFGLRRMVSETAAWYQELINAAAPNPPNPR